MKNEPIELESLGCLAGFVIAVCVAIGIGIIWFVVTLFK